MSSCYKGGKYIDIKVLSYYISQILLQTGHEVALRAEEFNYKSTFFIMHKKTMPTKNMPAKSHLRRNKFFIQTHTTIKFLLGFEDYIFNFFPFWSFVEVQISDVLMRTVRCIYNTSQLSSEILLSFLTFISINCFKFYLLVLLYLFLGTY